ncbi:hypothetical protein [Brevundimonas sp. NIBR11]|uniref:DUF6894 family protein n=1 Tax=Brevundimonas sp. NIBR11 TaxID=3015999 RepID=UPI0022F12667|nr:hypothetical protein [Brevundimonas sp. NIBR11]WGM30484.1 hypothetical protein KKHFBJBL_00708 [Brevundimonas sp. NIBR11]
MPRYFFRLSNGDVLRDEDGEELPDNGAACAAALDVFAETIPSKQTDLMDGGEYEVMVTDADDRQIYSITAQGRRFV